MATIDLLEDGLVENAAKVGEFLLDGLRSVHERQPLIAEVRGVGLMIGVEFGSAEVADAVEMAAFHGGLLTLRAGDSAIRISPPLVVNEQQAETGLRLFEEACAEIGAAEPTRWPWTGAEVAGPESTEGA